MIGVVQAFAPHYARARVLFLEAAAIAGLASEPHVLPHTGLHGETLATDVALDGATVGSLLAAGCDAYVAKPIDYREFLDQVARLLAAGHRPPGEGAP